MVERNRKSDWTRNPAGKVIGITFSWGQAPRLGNSAERIVKIGQVTGFGIRLNTRQEQVAAKVTTRVTHATRGRKSKTTSKPETTKVCMHTYIYICISIARKKMCVCMSGMKLPWCCHGVGAGVEGFKPLSDPRIRIARSPSSRREP